MCEGIKSSLTLVFVVVVVFVLQHPSAPGEFVCPLRPRQGGLHPTEGRQSREQPQARLCHLAGRVWGHLLSFLRRGTTKGHCQGESPVCVGWWRHQWTVVAGRHAAIGGNCARAGCCFGRWCFPFAGHWSYRECTMETSLMWTPLHGQRKCVLIREVSLFQRLICAQRYVYYWGLRNYMCILIRDVSLFQRCLLYCICITMSQLLFLAIMGKTVTCTACMHTLECCQDHTLWIDRLSPRHTL